MFATALHKRGRCRLLFVGDPAQLPPVDQGRSSDQDQGDGLSPAFGQQVPLHWKLTEVVRQARENPIIRLATAARQCIEVGAPFDLQAMGEQLREGDDAFLAMQPGGVAEISRLVADAIAHGQDTRALAFDNATVQAVNATVHSLVYPGQGDYPAGTLLMAQDGFTGLAPGTEGLFKRVNVAVRNSALLTVRSCVEEAHRDEPGRQAYKLELQAEGGDHLVCWVAIDQRQLQADISECFAEYRRCKLREQMAQGGEREALRRQAGDASRNGWALKARYAPVRYAYAMTVHKSQGSTFDAVVLAWDSFMRSRDIRLRNRLVYVALTRTRRFAVVCA
jgi:exodeoxyribonuclease-5